MRDRPVSRAPGVDGSTFSARLRTRPRTRGRRWSGAHIRRAGARDRARGRRRAAPPEDRPSCLQRSSGQGSPASGGCIGRRRLADPFAQKLRTLFGALTALSLSATEELGELLVFGALCVVDVDLQPAAIAEALLEGPDDVVVLVG